MVPDELILKPRTSILDVSIRFKVRGGSRQQPINMHTNCSMCWFQSALRFAVVSDGNNYRAYLKGNRFQSALRFAVVSDWQQIVPQAESEFQSALRFAVVSDLHISLSLDVMFSFNPL